MVAGTIAALFFIALPSKGHNDKAGPWRLRASEAKGGLALMRNRLESASAQRQAVSKPAAAPRSPAQERTVSSAASSLPQPPSSNPALLDPARQDEWNILVTGALQSEVQRRLRHTLPLEQEQRLVETLARLRDASIGLEREEPFDAEDPSALHDHLVRTLVRLEADRTFRAELGIGVSDFLQGLSGDQVEEVFPVEPASEPVP